ncbi:MAG: hypothetical protein ACKOUM_02795 [Sphingopyxis sp.]
MGWGWGAIWGAVAVLALAITLLSGVAEGRRLKRRNMDAVGFMPWPLITILGTLITLFAVAFAIKYGMKAYGG